MSRFTVKTIDELESIHHGAVKLAGAELGVRSFGMQVLDFPPEFTDYPEHDHAEDGQEEVYVVLRGSVEFEIDGERTPVRSGQIARISSDATRKLWPGPDGARIVAIGCAADRPYERPDHFQVEARG